MEGCEPPEEWLIARVCEEFQIPPSQAERELTHDPELVFEILQLRAYERAKRAYDGLSKLPEAARGEVLDNRVVKLVQETEFELVEAERHANG